MKKLKKQKKKTLTQKQIITRANKLLTEMSWLFGVDKFETRLKISKENSLEDEHIAATVSTDTDYQRISITLYPPFFRGSLEDQRGYLIHELTHIFTNNLLDIADDLRVGKLVTQKHLQSENEKATSKITLLIRMFLENKEVSKIKEIKKWYQGYTKI